MSYLTDRQNKEINAIYELCKTEYPDTPAYFLWLLAVDYYMTHVVGKKQQRQLSKEEINEEVKRLMKECEESKNKTLYENLQILENNTSNIVLDDYSSNILIE